MTKFKSIFFLFVILFVSCNTVKKIKASSYSYPITECPEASIIEYSEFTPKAIEGIELEGYYINQAYEIGSVYILSASAEGNFESTDKLINWGDCLLTYQNKKIEFQSNPVGDVYLYEPHFYKNDNNDSVVIVCQLGYEYYFGGEAFLFHNGKVEFIGLLDIEALNPELGLTDVLIISEKAKEIRFEFQSDSLVYKPGEKDIILENSNIYYTFYDHKLELKGL